MVLPMRNLRDGKDHRWHFPRQQPAGNGSHQRRRFLLKPRPS